MVLLVEPTDRGVVGQVMQSEDRVKFHRELNYSG